MRREKGFTLIEILVVVAIIAILASIVIVGLAGFRSRGRDARRVADLNTVRNVLELYRQKYAQYPSDGDYGVLHDDLIKPATGLGINNLPQDPINTDPLQYGYCSYQPLNGGVDQGYVLSASLENANADVQTNSYKGSDCKPKDAAGTAVDCHDGGMLYCVSF